MHMHVPFYYRILLLLVIFGAVFVTPWWCSIFFAGCAILFLHIYEAVFAGVLLDALYAGHLFSFTITEYIFTSLLLLLVSVSWVLGKEMNFFTK